MGLNVFLIAGEVSGDKLGAALMDGLTAITDVSFSGIGGQLMEARGLKSRFPMSELSLMGLVEILPKYKELKARIRETAEAILAAKPDVLITIDSPDFCLRVARLVKAKSDIRTVHYVAPTVWAWRSGRAEKMAKDIDQVLALFPFEPPFMEAAGMECDFVGHPVVAERQATKEEALEFRAKHGISQGPLILALPGSRRGEVTRLSDRFGAALKDVLVHHPDASIVVPCAEPVFSLVQKFMSTWPGNVILLPPDTADKAAAFRAADVALAASGTVSLELAAAQTPMVIAYDMAWLSRVIISRMLQVDTVTLVNLVSDTRVVPEFIGKNCKSEDIAKAILDVLSDPTAQKPALELTMQRLGYGQEAPGLQAARAVLRGLA